MVFFMICSACDGTGYRVLSVMKRGRLSCLFQFENGTFFGYLLSLSQLFLFEVVTPGQRVYYLSSFVQIEFWLLIKTFTEKLSFHL